MAFRRRRFLVSGLGFGLGSACASMPSSGSKISFWTMQLKPEFDDYIKGLIAAFEKQQIGSKVTWVDVPWADMENKILAAVAANTGPDVANLNPQFATKLAEKRALVNMTTQVSAQEQALYFPNIWKANQLGGMTFGLPWYVTTDITLYNRTLFQQAGLDPSQPPKTYAELAKVAEAIKSKTGKHAFLLTMDGTQVLEAMVQMGLTLLTLQRRAGFDNEVGRAAFQYWVTLFQKGWVPREILTESHRRAVELYQAGELAMLITGPQFFAQIQTNAPEIAKVSDVSSQVSGANGKKSASVMNLDVSQRSANISLATQFALFVTNSTNQLSFSKLANTLPSTVETAKDPYFTSQPKSLQDKARLVSASQLAQAEVLIPPIEGLDVLKKAIYEELQQAMLGQKPVAEAVTTAAQRWDQRA